MDIREQFEEAYSGRDYRRDDLGCYTTAGLESEWHGYLCGWLDCLRHMGVDNAHRM